MGAEISAIIAEQAFDCLDAPIVRVTPPDIPAIPAAATLEEFYMPNVDKIVAAFQQVMSH